MSSSLSSKQFGVGDSTTAIRALNVLPQAGDDTNQLIAKAIYLLAGGSGLLVIDNTTPQTARTLGFIAITDVVFASATADAASGYLSTTGLAGKTIAQGTTLPARLSAWTLTSGTAGAILA